MILTNEIFTPPPDMTISEWADTYRELPAEAASEPGHWNTDRAPYQREMMNAICPPSVEKVVMMTAAQIGKTEILLNTIGFFMHKEPSPILLLEPTLQMAEAFSKDRLATMLRDCECLHGKVKDPRARDSGNTLLHKTFPGGHITMAGANSPASLASRPIRILLADEVTHYPISAGSEGDPLSLAVMRTQNFWNRKIIIVSTPLNSMSRIVEEYEHSTREEWTLACPKCGEYNALAWERVIYEGKILPVMVCEKCGHEGNEREWKSQSHTGKWRRDNESSYRGFHVNALASPWVSWPEIVRKYVEAYRSGADMLKVWQNTNLGLPYEESYGTIEITSMSEHEEDYGAELHDGVLLLTAGIDTQDNRLEVEILGHGLNNDTYGIEYRIIYGDPGSVEIWNKLDEYLSREWHYADGDSLGIACACIDSAGHFTDEVYKFCKDKVKRNIFPIVGRGKFGLPSVSRPTMHKRGQIYLFKLGVSTIKGEINMRLNAKRGENGYCYFPKDPSRGYNGIYYAGLLSERMIIKRKGGQEYVTWEVRSRNVRNEPLDCRVYAMGAFKILNPDMSRHKRKTNEPEVKPVSKPVRRVIRPRILRRGMSL